MQFRKLRGMESRPTAHTVRCLPPLTSDALPFRQALLTLYYPTGPLTAPWRLQEQQP